MGKDMYKINEFKVFNKYIENPTYIFYCGGRSSDKTFMTKKLLKEKEVRNVEKRY